MHSPLIYVAISLVVLMCVLIDIWLTRTRLKATDFTELGILYAKAQQVAADFIYPPVDKQDEETVRKATPLQAIEALEGEVKKWKYRCEDEQERNRLLSNALAATGEEVKQLRRQAAGRNDYSQEGK